MAPSSMPAEIIYPSRMSFYNTPPNLGISLEAFEEWAIDRLRVLTKLQQLQLSGKTGLKDLDSGLKPTLEKYLPLGSSRNVSDEVTQKQRQRTTTRISFCGWYTAALQSCARSLWSAKSCCFGTD